MQRMQAGRDEKEGVKTAYNANNSITEFSPCGLELLDKTLLLVHLFLKERQIRDIYHFSKLCWDVISFLIIVFDHLLSLCVCVYVNVPTGI